MALPKQLLKSETMEKKTFSYSKGTITINLTCRVDIKQEMKDLVEVLERSVADVKAELTARFPR